MACDHGSACRLTMEVLTRLIAIQSVCRSRMVTDAEVVKAAEKLAGIAAVHCGVVVEHGCMCSADVPSAA